VLWRVLRYLLCFPLWEDEAFICLNFLELDYRGLARELHNCQIAPLLFLWGELTSLHLLGPSEWSLRLLPFLAGMSSLLLFWRLARLMLPPLAGTLAVGLLAVAIWPVSMGAFTKPYAFDLFMSLLLLLPAVHWLRQPDHLRWLILLSLATPLALFSSYPVVFVAGAVSLALLPCAWRQGGKARLWWCVYNAVLVASFAGHYFIAARSQLHSPDKGLTTEHGMQNFWAGGFPPSSPLALAKWLVLALTGQMMAFPVGAQDGGSAVTTLLCLMGAWHFWTRRRRTLLVLCAAPFALGIVAAALHRYPYGASCRLSQHLAPAICLSAGMGSAALLERLRSVPLRRRWILGVCGGLVFIGAIGMVRDVVYPYRNLETLWTKQVMRAFAIEARSGAPIVVMNKPEELDGLFRWYIELYGDRVSWDGRIDWEKAAASGEILCLHYNWDKLNSPEQMPVVPVQEPMKLPLGAEFHPPQSNQTWILVKGITDTAVPPDWRSPLKHIHQLRMIRKATNQEPTTNTIASKGGRSG
jgi:hypothetical protein